MTEYKYYADLDPVSTSSERLRIKIDIDPNSPRY